MYSNKSSKSHFLSIIFCVDVAHFISAFNMHNKFMCSAKNEETVVIYGNRFTYFHFRSVVVAQVVRTQIRKEYL